MTSNDSLPRSRDLARALLLLACVALASACASRRAPVHEQLRAVGQADPLAVSDALEALIAVSQDTPADREYAYAIVLQNSQDTAAGMFARADVTGRLVQQRGFLAANLVPDVERSARRSRELDPNFRDGAATRLLGTLYVIAPGAILQHGDSEQGLELLEGLVEARPDVLENHLRVAEAYIALGDATPARPHLCYCLANKEHLRHDEQVLLSHLFIDAGSPSCPPAPKPAP